MMLSSASDSSGKIVHHLRDPEVTVTKEHDSDDRMAFFFLLACPIQAVKNYSQGDPDKSHWCVMVQFQDEDFTTRVVEMVQEDGKCLPRYASLVHSDAHVFLDLHGHKVVQSWEGIITSPKKLHEASCRNTLNGQPYRVFSASCQVWTKQFLFNFGILIDVEGIADRPMQAAVEVGARAVHDKGVEGMTQAATAMAGCATQVATSALSVKQTKCGQGRNSTIIVTPGQSYLCRALEDQGKIKKGDVVWVGAHREMFGGETDIFVLKHCLWFNSVKDGKDLFITLPNEPAEVMLENPFFLASCPEALLEDASIVTTAYKGAVAAGARDDYFNKDFVFNAGGTKAERWKEGMLGKMYQCALMMSEQHPSKEVIAVAIIGGPACDWERHQLEDTSINAKSIRVRLPQLRLFVCKNVAAMRSFLDRGAPCEECA